MKAFRRVRQALRRAEQRIAAQPVFADPMDANRAMFHFQETGVLPSDPRQAEFIRRWDEMLREMEASIPTCAQGDV